VFAVNCPPQAPAAGAGGLLDRVSSSSVIAPGGVLADRLEDLLDRDVLALVAAGWIEPAVEHDPGDVEAGHRHDRGRDRLGRSR
jgi:hypothetical protein